MKRLVSFLVAAIVLLTLFAACAKSLEKLSAAELLDLGEKYLTEMNYEKAVVYFNRLIEVESRNVRSYTGAAEAYIGIGDMPKAIEVLQRGLEQLPDNPDITKMLDPLLYEQQRENLATQAKPILTELAALCSNEDYDSVFAKMQTDDFSKVTALSMFLNRPYIEDTENGKIGVYEVNSENFGNFMLYFGEYKEETRNGKGVWLGYYNGNNYFAKGVWDNDKPNGEMQIKEWHSSLSEEITYRIITGNVIDGLWDGDVSWSFESDSESTLIFPVQFDMGHWVVIEIDNDGENGETEYIVSKSGNNESGIMTADNIDELNGIIGFEN